MTYPNFCKLALASIKAAFSKKRNFALHSAIFDEIWQRAYKDVSTERVSGCVGCAQITRDPTRQTKACSLQSPQSLRYGTSSTLITAQKTDPQLMLIYKHISLALVKNTITLKM